MQIIALNFRGKVPNRQLRIAAHLQGAQKPTHNANLTKELQSPTHGKQLSIQKIIANLYNIIKHIAGSGKNKTKRKNQGLRPLIFPFLNSLRLKSDILLPL